MDSSSSSTSNSKAIWRYVVSLVISCAAVLLIGDLLLTRFVVLGHPWNGAAQLGRVFNESDSEEIPIYGASYAMRSYLADSLGPRYYVYGRPASNFEKLEPLLNAEFAKDRTTPVVIDFYERFLEAKPNADLAVREFIPYTNKPGVTALLQEYNNYAWHYRLPGLRYFGSYLGYVQDYLRQREQRSRNYFCNGAALYLPETSLEKFERYIAVRQANSQPFTVDSAVAARFIALLASRPERKVVLVVSPHHKSAYPGTVDLEAMRKYLKSLELMLPNVRTLIFDGSNYPRSRFKDSIHMNERGARYFSGKLRKEFDALGLP